MSETNDGIFSCKGVCWIIGALLGIAMFLLLAGKSFVLALIIGIIVLIAAALLLRKFFCDDSALPAPVVAPTPAAATDTVAGEKQKSADPAPGDPKGFAAPDTTTSGASVDSASKTVAAEATSDAVANETAPAAKADTPASKPAKKSAAKKAPAKKPAAPKAAPAKAAPAKKAPAKAKPATSTAKPATPVVTGVPKKPRTMKAPRKAGADDLKQLKGVGPKLEQTLNDLGFWHFDQIAKWDPDQISWVDDNLSFKGRIERDGWVDQAEILAKGGETAFSNKVKKGDVYKG